MRAHHITTQARVGCRGRTKRIIAALLLAACLALAAPLAFAPRAAAFVYWTNAKTGDVGRANLNGTGVDHKFIGDAKTVFDVAVDATHVYWTTGDAIGRANLDGTGVDRSFITGLSLSYPEGVAVDAAHVYWSSYGGGTIGRANLDGTGVDQSFIAARDPTQGLDGPTEVAVDAAHVYWSVGGLAVEGGQSVQIGGIGRANLGGTGVNQSFIPDVNSPCSMAVDAAHVYWTGAHAVGRANLDGTGVNRSFISEGGCGIAVDSAHVYWASGGIARANLDGTGLNKSLISAPRRSDPINGVAVDALFSNEFGFGKVKKDERKGTARLTVKVPGPGGFELRGNGIKTASKDAPHAGKLKLAVKPTGTAKQKLNQAGEAKVRAAVTYTPDGGIPDSPNTERKKIQLVKQR
jgi:hypothetical protein